MKGPGLIELTLGTIAFEAIRLTARLALRRDDVHEARHLAAMVFYGNSEHTHMRCLLPENFDPIALEFLAANRRARGEAEQATGEGA